MAKFDINPGSFGALLVVGSGARAVSRKTPIYFICISHPLPNKRKMEFDQDFGARYGLNYSITKRLNAMGSLCLWHFFFIFNSVQAIDKS